jgi:hypothetical protein
MIVDIKKAFTALIKKHLHIAPACAGFREGSYGNQMNPPRHL